MSSDSLEYSIPNRQHPFIMHWTWHECEKTTLKFFSLVHLWIEHGGFRVSTLYRVQSMNTVQCVHSLVECVHKLDCRGGCILPTWLHSDLLLAGLATYGATPMQAFILPRMITFHCHFAVALQSLITIYISIPKDVV